MSKRAQAGKDDRFRPEAYRELGKLGWRVPESDKEVRAAEEWVARSSIRLPAKLHHLPNERQPRGDGLLGRYLREDVHHRSTEDSKSMDEGKPDRELDR